MEELLKNFKAALEAQNVSPSTVRGVVTSAARALGVSTSALYPRDAEVISGANPIDIVEKFRGRGAGKPMPPVVEPAGGDEATPTEPASYRARFAGATAKEIADAFGGDKLLLAEAYRELTGETAPEGTAASIAKAIKAALNV